jgi:hypothetical protein
MSLLPIAFSHAAQSSSESKELSDFWVIFWIVAIIGLIWNATRLRTCGNPKCGAKHKFSAFKDGCPSCGTQAGPK